MTDPVRGDVWWVDFEPARGHEQGGTRPAVVVSNDIFNGSDAGLVVVVPLTTKARALRSFLRVEPPEGGLRQISFIICDQIRTLARSRLTRRTGALSARTLGEVERRLKILLDLA